jgi:hypothetical protein
MGKRTRKARPDIGTSRTGLASPSGGAHKLSMERLAPTWRLLSETKTVTVVPAPLKSASEFDLCFSVPSTARPQFAIPFTRPVLVGSFDTVPPTNGFTLASVVTPDIKLWFGLLFGFS